MPRLGEEEGAPTYALRQCAVKVKDGAAEVSLAQNMMARCAARAGECGAAARYALRVLISAARAVAARLDSELLSLRGGTERDPGCIVMLPLQGSLRALWASSTPRLLVLTASDRPAGYVP